MQSLLPSLRRRFRGTSASWFAAVAGLATVAVIAAGCSNAGSVSGPVATPTTTPGVLLATEPSPVGRILTTGSGYTLYEFAIDTPTHSACVSAACVYYWPPLLSNGSPMRVGKGLRQSLVSTIVRPDGARQVTYNGHPLYRWRSDTKPGMVLGQALDNLGGYWYVLSPAGRPITTQFMVT